MPASWGHNPSPEFVREAFLGRFEASYEADPNSGCWLWNKALRTDGYGNTSFGKRDIGAHRASYIAHVGLVPDGLFVCHRCDTPACVNPHHLFLGTAADNNRDRELKGRTARGPRVTHCTHGHEFTPENTYTWRGSRTCRACNRLARQRVDQKRRGARG